MQALQKTEAGQTRLDYVWSAFLSFALETYHAMSHVPKLNT
jgi:hypothetical protein